MQITFKNIVILNAGIHMPDPIILRTKANALQFDADERSYSEIKPASDMEFSKNFPSMFIFDNGLKMLNEREENDANQDIGTELELQNFFSKLSPENYVHYRFVRANNMNVSLGNQRRGNFINHPFHENPALSDFFMSAMSL